MTLHRRGISPKVGHETKFRAEQERLTVDKMPLHSQLPELAVWRRIVCNSEVTLGRFLAESSIDVAKSASHQLSQNESGMTVLVTTKDENEREEE